MTFIDVRELSIHGEICDVAIDIHPIRQTTWLCVYVMGVHPGPIKVAFYSNWPITSEAKKRLEASCAERERANR